eukprot:scaffold12452_cov113-Isochrysis_galbana.AAC.9
MHVPELSNCGRPARPAIWITSMRVYSTNPAELDAYLQVLQRTTRCAGRLTPCARPEVEHKMGSSPAANMVSTSRLSCTSSPAWWKPTPQRSISEREPSMALDEARARACD